MKSQQEIEREAGLRAEVERLTRERDEAHERADHFMAEMKLSRQRAESAESELALLRPALQRALVELKTWHGAMDESEWGGVAMRLTREAIGIAEHALARSESAEKGETK